jgi:hypothetical protein
MDRMPMTTLVVISQLLIVKRKLKEKTLTTFLRGLTLEVKNE